jgi:hypothetical protein
MYESKNLLTDLDRWACGQMFMQNYGFLSVQTQRSNSLLQLSIM